MADPVLHLGGSLTRFTWEWRLDSTNTWTLTVSNDGAASTIAGAVVLAMDDGQELAGAVAAGAVVWTIGPESEATPPRGFCSASIVNRTTAVDGSTQSTVWARGLVYTV